MSPEGREHAKALALELSSHKPDLVFSSTEPKAVETGDIIARELGIRNQVVPDLHEHEGRQAGCWVSEPEFRARLSRFFSNPSVLVFGTETADSAHDRFARAIDGIAAKVSSGCVVVSHGTVISLFSARANVLDPNDVWGRLTSPGFIRMGIPGFEILEEWRLPDSCLYLTDQADIPTTPIRDGRSDHRGL